MKNNRNIIYVDYTLKSASGKCNHLLNNICSRWCLDICLEVIIVIITNHQLENIHNRILEAWGRSLAQPYHRNAEHDTLKYIWLATWTPKSVWSQQSYNCTSCSTECPAKANPLEFVRTLKRQSDTATFNMPIAFRN